MQEPKKNDEPQIEPDFSPVEAGLQSLDKDVKEIKGEIAVLRGESKNVIIGVLLALVFIIATVAIEVIFFHTRENASTRDFEREYYREIESIKQNQNLMEQKTQKINDLEEQIKLLKKKIK